MKLGVHQSRVYAAEAAIAGLGRYWTRVRDVQRYVDGLVESDWFYGMWPWLVRVAVERRGSGARWSASHPLDAAGPGGRPTEGVLLLAQLTQPTVLHEIAHLVAPVDAGHGPEFVDVLLELVRREMGVPAWAEFRVTLDRTPCRSGVA